MTRTIICITILLLIMGIVGRYEYRYAQQDARHEQLIGSYERRLDRVVEDAAGMEKAIAYHRLHRSRPFQHDLNTEEFLKIMADYLARDGRCKVVINKIDWSTWAEKYHKGSTQ